MLWILSFLLSTADLGDATASTGLVHPGNSTLDDSTTQSGGSLGLLFDTFVPVSSIVTIFIVVGFTLPRHECFGLFWLFWWVAAVAVSLLSVDNDGDGQQNNSHSDGGLFPTSSTRDRISGVIVLAGLPLAMLLVLWMWWKMDTSLTSRRKHRRGPKRRILPRIDPIQDFVLNHVPPWSMVAIHIYRLDGLSVLVPFWNGEVPNFVGYQTILLDVVMGITAIPLTYLLYVSPRRASARGRQKAHKFRPPAFLRDALWFWNSLGLYDLSSAYLVLVLNVCGWGGPHITQPPLLPRLGKHPFPLLILFQVPLAVAVHVLMLTHSEELTKVHQEQWKKSRDLGLVLPH
jgi:hypothetical protein